MHEISQSFKTDEREVSTLLYILTLYLSSENCLAYHDLVLELLKSK